MRIAIPAHLETPEEQDEYIRAYFQGYKDMKLAKSSYGTELDAQGIAYNAGQSAAYRDITRGRRG